MERQSISHDGAEQGVGVHVSAAGDITKFLREWRDGDASALHRVTEKMYSQLKDVADRTLSRDWGTKSLQPTELVHETFLRLAAMKQFGWKDRQHFFGIVARLMRQILVDRARYKLADKRGGGMVITSDQSDGIADEARLTVDLIGLDLALKELADKDEDLCRIVELRFFGGMTVKETAQVLGISPRTVERDWRLAKAWLRRRLSASATS